MSELPAPGRVDKRIQKRAGKHEQDEPNAVLPVKGASCGLFLDKNVHKGQNKMRSESQDENPSDGDERYSCLFELHGSHSYLLSLDAWSVQAERSTLLSRDGDDVDVTEYNHR